MDRTMSYSGALPLETEMLLTEKYAYIGLSKLAEAMLGAASITSGLAVTPTTPGSLSVKCAPGQIYALKNVDDSAYSSVAPDTTHQILKQGIANDVTTLSCPAPSTSGYSQNYLVQAAFSETDGGSAVLLYYNVANPAAPFSGPGNSGAPNNTVRINSCVVTVKPGVPATTGTQTTPLPDSGCVGVAVVTVAHGSPAISSGDISTYSNAANLAQGGAIAASRNSGVFIAITGGNVTLAQPQLSYPIVTLTGTLTSDCTIVVPDSSAQWIFSNQTTGAYSVYVSNTGGGTDVFVPQGGAAEVFATGLGSVKFTGASSLPARKYKPAAQALPSTGSTLTFPHILGATPDFCTYLGICTSPDGGYSIGDVVRMCPLADSSGGGNTTGFGEQPGPSSVTLIFGNYSGVCMQNKTTGHAFFLTPGSWNIQPIFAIL